jgi:hypothetical protein
VLYLLLIILSVGGDVPVDSEALLVTDFMNLKIKLAQSFGGAHRGRVCMRMFIGVSGCTCMSICICTMLLKKGFSCTWRKWVASFMEGGHVGIKVNDQVGKNFQTCR